MEENREENREERSERREEQPPQKSGGGFIKEMLIYIIAMVIMTVIAVVVVTMVINKDNTEAAVTENTPPPTKTPQYQDDSLNENDPIYTIEDIVVNTADIGFPRLLKVKIHIIFREQDLKNNFAESEVRQAQIKELLIMTFSSKTAEELKQNDVVNELKDHLRKEMNFIFGPGGVKRVYISEYFVQ